MSRNALAQAVFAELASIEPVRCPCGEARRAYAETPGSPLSLHLVDIDVDAKSHYHTEHTETYYFLECGPDAAMEIDGVRTPVQQGMSVLIPPGVRHRAVGKMRILNIVTPPFDPADEHLD